MRLPTESLPNIISTSGDMSQTLAPTQSTQLHAAMQPQKSSQQRPQQKTSSRKRSAESAFMSEEEIALKRVKIELFVCQTHVTKLQAHINTLEGKYAALQAQVTTMALQTRDVTSALDKLGKRQDSLQHNLTDLRLTAHMLYARAENSLRSTATTLWNTLHLITTPINLFQQPSYPAVTHNEPPATAATAAEAAAAVAAAAAAAAAADKTLICLPPRHPAPKRTVPLAAAL